MSPIELVNQGAVYIESGLYHNAIQVLTRSLTILRDHMFEDRSSTSMLLHNSFLCNEKKVIEHLSVDRTVPEELLNTLLYDSTIPRDLPYFLYKAPFHIRGLQDLLSSEGLSSIILFNMAVAFHMDAVKNSQPKTKYNRIIQLYENAYRLQLQDQEDPNAFPTDPDALFRSMAILNNLAHLHFNAANDREAKECCDSLWKIVLYAKFDDLARSKCVECFFDNVTKFLVRHSQSAPAA